jgi:hypothetical protein
MEVGLVSCLEKIIKKDIKKLGRKKLENLKKMLKPIEVHGLIKSKMS